MVVCIVVNNSTFRKLKSWHLVPSSFSSVSQLCLAVCDPMNCSTPGLPVHHQPPESTQTHVHWVGDAIQPSYPLSSPSPPALSLSNEFSELISFRMDWLDLLAVQGTLKSLLQHHSSKASILWCSAFFIVQLSHLVTYFVENRWGNDGNSDRLYFLGLQSHCRWWLQPWN